MYNPGEAAVNGNDDLIGFVRNLTAGRGDWF